MEWTENQLGVLSCGSYDIRHRDDTWEVLYYQEDACTTLSVWTSLDDAKEAARRHLLARATHRRPGGRWIDDGTWFSPYWESR